MSQLFSFPEICITEASAGSGKTYALARRYVQLLLKTAAQNPQSFKNILAITFTNKAAVEMKSRVLFFLKKIALNQLTPEQEKDFLAPIGLSSERAAELAFGLMESLIRHYHFFSIKTIDSFINTLLAGCAFKINLSARFKIERNSTDYLQQSLDQWIAKSPDQAKIRKLLEEFVHQYLFLENRSGWFPKEDLLEVLKNLFGEFNTYQKSFLTFPINGRNVYLAKGEFLDLAKKIYSLIDPSMNKRTYDSLTKFLEENPHSFDLDSVPSAFANPEFPANKNVEISTELAKQWGLAHKSVSDLCLIESYGVFNPYVLIFEKVLEVFKILCSQDDILFLSELNKKAASLFEDGISMSELYYRLAVRFQHYLIDEFQDTSLVQWQNLLPMIQEAYSTGGSLFVVGDKKQAIYSFRGGESRLFDKMPQFFPQDHLKQEYLVKNRRSHKQIVEFNNMLFSKVNLQSFFDRRQDYYNQKDKSSQDVFFNPQDIEHVQNTYAHAQQEAREDLQKGYVQVRCIEGKRKEERQEKIRQELLETIRELQGRFHLKDIAVLTRTNAQVEEVTGWLLSEGIYAQSERSCDIKNHGLIIEIVDFLRFLDSPIDNLNFARFLLGEIFSKITGIAQAELRDFLFECRKQKDSRGEFYLYKEFRTKYPDIWGKYLEDFFNQVGIYPVYELVVSIYAQFRLHEFSDAQGFLMHFLELIKRREEFSCDVEGFIDYFDGLETEERFITTVSQQAVSVMTLHKAKGLEFPVVLIPFLEMPVQASKSADKTLSYVLDVSEEGLRMMRLKKTYGRFNELIKKRYEQEYKDSLSIELNNVYVALTRAVSELYIMIPERSSNSINPALFLLENNFASWGEKTASSKIQSTTQTIPVLTSHVNRRWVGQLKEDNPEDQARQAWLRQQGVVLHFCLSKIMRLNPDISSVVQKALKEAKSHLNEDFDESVLSKQLLEFIQRPDVCPFFAVDEQVEVFCEQDIVNRYGDSKRIDRLMIFKDKVWVIDFKTSRADEIAHEEQIKEYEGLVSQLYPGLKTQGFLVYFQ